MLNGDSCPCKKYSKHATTPIVRIFRNNIYKNFFGLIMELKEFTSVI